MTTPHIEAPDGAFAPVVLFPGDPKRATYIAENHMTDAELVTAVRGINGYTGTFEGTQVSVMASGMGIPSASIYATELFRFYDVETIIRVGTAGGMQPDIAIGDVVIASAAATNSSLPKTILGADVPLVADFDVLSTAIATAADLGVNARVGTAFSGDVFYEPTEDGWRTLGAAGVLAVEMEAAGIYACANVEGKNGLAMMTVSDNLFTHEAMTSLERQTSLDEMISLGLNTAKRLTDN